MRALEISGTFRANFTFRIHSSFRITTALRVRFLFSYSVPNAVRLDFPERRKECCQPMRPWAPDLSGDFGHSELVAPLLRMLRLPPGTASPLPAPFPTLSDFRRSPASIVCAV